MKLYKFAQWKCEKMHNGITKICTMNDIETFGFYFEALCERDLRIYGESLDAKLYHYRENTSGLEIEKNQVFLFNKK